MAGVLLTQYVFALSGSVYGCVRDADFPKVILLSFPFSEMLLGEVDVANLRKEVRGGLSFLRENGAEVIAIACNTLHAFLEEEDLIDLVHIQEVTKEAISVSEIPLVLCTTTSVEFAIHQRFFPCVYPSKKVQGEIDLLIDLILAGAEMDVIVPRLLEIIEREESSTIILGCTELSLFAKSLDVSNKRIIDTLQIVAKKIISKNWRKS